MYDHSCTTTGGPTFLVCGDAESAAFRSLFSGEFPEGEVHNSRIRNIGLGFAYSALALTSTSKGLEKITPNKLKIKEELDNNWEVLTEAVQTLMRYEGVPDAYEQLKNLSRGSKLNKETYISFVKTLAISEESKNKLLQLKPSAYIGIAEDLSKN